MDRDRRTAEPPRSIVRSSPARGTLVKIHALCFVVVRCAVCRMCSPWNSPLSSRILSTSLLPFRRGTDSPNLLCAVHPQPVIIDGHHVVQQHLLPIHGGAAALLVQLDGLAAFGLIIRQYKRLCGGLASEPGRFPGHAQRHPLSTSYQAHVGHLPENGHEKSTLLLHRAFCFSYSGIISKSLFPSSEYCR